MYAYIHIHARAYMYTRKRTRILTYDHRGKRDLTLSDDVAKRRERKRDGIDFEAQFSDDEQEAPLAEEVCCILL